MKLDLFAGDALEVMAGIPEKSVNAIISDPPYGTTKNPWDQVIPFDEMWKEVWRVCKGAVVFTASQPFTSLLVASQIRKFRHEWVWEKNKASGHLNAKVAPMKAHESIVVFSDGACPYYPQMTEGHDPMNAYVQTSNGSNYGSTSRPSGGGSTQRYPRSVQRFDVVNNDSPEKVHPTQKPVDMFEWLIKTYTLPGETVLDFSMGSGTTGVACRRTERNFIGVDISDEYVSIARSRILGDAGPLFADIA